MTLAEKLNFIFFGMFMTEFLGSGREVNFCGHEEQTSEKLS